MLAPDCEAEAAPAVVRDLGRQSLACWRAVYPGLVTNGSLVVAAPRDRPDLVRFARLTEARHWLDEAGIAESEPALGTRFPAGLLFPDEAHMSAPDALAHLLVSARAAGAEIAFGSPLPDRPEPGAVLIDCRGLAARGELPTLRGVRGERILVRAPDVTLSRPVRLLHPRHPLYVVPWPEGRYMIGATVIESEEAGAASVRSVLELLGTAYALHPAFGEAEILDVGAGVRPAFPDNVPRALVCDGARRILVNGAYRHGYLLAPILAHAVLDVVAGTTHAHPHPLVRFGH
jgi:glycine oxidase